MNQSTIDILTKNGLTIQGKCISSSQVHTLFCPKKTDTAFNTLTKDKNMLTLDALKRVLKAIRNKKTLALLEKLNNVNVSVVSSDEKTDLGIIKRYDDGSTKICMNGHDIDIMLVNNRLWTRADQFCKALGYTDEVRNVMREVCIDDIYRPCIGILRHMSTPTNTAGFDPAVNVDFESLSQDEQMERKYLFGDYKAIDLDPNRFAPTLRHSYLSRAAILKLILRCTKSPAMKLKLENDMTKVYAIVCDTAVSLNKSPLALASSLIKVSPKNSETIKSLNGKKITTSIIFNGIEFKILAIGKEIWFNGLEIAMFCGFKTPKKQLLLKKYSSYKQSYENLYNLVKSYEVGQKFAPPQENNAKLGQKFAPPQENNHPLGKYPIHNDKKVLYINYQGVVIMIAGSKKEALLPFQQYIGNVMNNIRKHGTHLDSDALTTHTHYLQFDDGVPKHVNDKKCLVYLCYVGIINNEHRYMYGISDDVYRRLDEHKVKCKHLKSFLMIDVMLTPNYIQVERNIKDELIRIGMYRTMTRLDGSEDTEQFSTSSKYSYEDIKNMCINIINNYKPPQEDDDTPSPPLQIKDKPYNDYDMLKLTQDHEYRMAELKLRNDGQEKTKQLELEARKLELQCKLAGIV